MKLNITAVSIIRRMANIIGNNNSINTDNPPLSLETGDYSLFVVIGFALDDGTCTIYLFGKYQPYHLVRECHLRE